MTCGLPGGPLPAALPEKGYREPDGVCILDADWFPLRTKNHPSGMQKALPLWLLALCVGLVLPLSAQLTPLTDSDLCYVVGNGAVLTDPGGLGDEYDSCNCNTTTTLCAVDGSAVTVEFTQLAVEDGFDYIVILDGDNPTGADEPYDINTDPANVDLQLFNNSSGFFGSFAYGAGAQAGQADFGALTTTSFTATNATGCLTLVLFADGIISEDGFAVDITVASGAAHPGDGLICGENLDCLPPADPTISDVTTTGATLTFGSVGNAGSYSVEYGPAGFSPGTGAGTLLTVTDTTVALGNLTQNTDYDVFIIADCGATDGTSAPTNLSFSTPVSCPDVVNFGLITVFASEVLLGWNDTEQGGTYEVSVGTTPFDPTAGTAVATVTATDDDVIVSGLLPQTEYAAFVRVLCENGDTSNYSGPIVFETCARTDIGVAAVVGPQSGCELGSAQVQIALTNYGADPQSLFAYHFAVNGEEVDVNRPVDGIFTDVLGKGDTALVTFDVPYDFSTVGAYRVAAWTMLDGDVTIGNDTAYLTVNHIPTITSLPYYENFESGDGGWAVGEESINSSWTYGTPQGIDISSAAGGLNAWVTNLSGDYNLNETSYLVSPCIDFSALTEDPILSFALNYATESCCDEGFLEVSTNGGTSWTKLGTAGTGLNWYNDDFDDFWNGIDQSPEGWVPARQTLTGTAGQASVRLRFVFNSDFSVVREGFGIDNVLISATLGEDLAALGVGTTGEACGSEDDVVSLTVGNFGDAIVIGYNVSYTVNGGPVFTEPVAGAIPPGETDTYIFDQTFDSSTDGNYAITAWVTNADDDVLINDTSQLVFNNLPVAPLREDFEGGSLPDGWAAVGNQPVTDAHGNESFVVPYNLFGTFSTALLATPRVGPIALGDSLRFDYRYTNWPDGTTAADLTADDQIIVAVSSDCGVSFLPIFTFTGDTHTPTTEMTTLAVDLSGYVGESIIVRLEGVWGSGDYWLDIDNVNVLVCPETLVTFDLIDASGNDESDGRATAQPVGGTAPYTYVWSDGGTGNPRTDLAPGDYTVTVTDALDCTQVLDVTIDVTVGTAPLPEWLQRIELTPNPTADQVQLSVVLSEAQPLQIEVLNQVGQVLHRHRPGRVADWQHTLDLSAVGSGLYLVRVRAADQVRVERLIVLPRP